MGIPALQSWLSSAVRNPIHWETRLIADEQLTISETLIELVDTQRIAISCSPPAAPARRHAT